MPDSPVISASCAIALVFASPNALAAACCRAFVSSSFKQIIGGIELAGFQHHLSVRLQPRDIRFIARYGGVQKQLLVAIGSLRKPLRQQVGRTAFFAHSTRRIGLRRRSVF